MFIKFHRDDSTEACWVQVSKSNSLIGADLSRNAQPGWYWSISTAAVKCDRNMKVNRTGWPEDYIYTRLRTITIQMWSGWSNDILIKMRLSAFTPASPGIIIQIRHPDAHIKTCRKWGLYQTNTLTDEAHWVIPHLKALPAFSVNLLYFS